MRAIVLSKYGSPDLLQLKEVEKPTPKENEVLVKIHASAINDYDWSMVRGKPFIYRLMFGLFKPKRNIPGMELSGTIEAVGAAAKTFKVGDEVYGDTSDFGFGTFAEYIAINEKALVLKPEKMSFEEAATISHAAMLAYQGLIDSGKLKEQQKILINGAGGGVGTFGLQIAKLHHAEVTGVDTGAKLEMMKSLGFDHVIDYKKVDFTKTGEQYDLILDAKTNRSPFAYARSLNQGGTYATVGGTLSRLFQILCWKAWISKFKKKNLRIVALKTNKDLDIINKLYEEGKIKCVIDGPHELENVPKALQYFGEGKHTGKVVVKVAI
jgi:NADPH:quinone reductase-like Zn-dependent oxidoreductase